MSEREWKSIAELTDEVFERAELDRRLIVTNSCNGPHMVTSEDGYFSADDVRDDPWDYFFVLPDNPPPPPVGDE